MSITEAHSQDIFIWPDDMTGPTWCFREEYEQYGYMSDDFRVVPVDSKEWDEIVAADTRGEEPL